MVLIGFIGLAAVGAVARFSLSTFWNRSEFPYGTLAINVVGSFALGLIASRGQSTLLLIGTAALGSFTTFSTVMLECFDFGEDGRYRAAIAYLSITVVAGCFAAYLGLELGT